ncbi:MAG: ABC transporter permease subunit [Brachybacterium sp.]|uniref:ABC transporter permease n=1 Tax=Brachybacterium sp. TaxID=1891286 RepID=UPI002649705F|nr:ABC transporter permease subunit [Brachybacterium sp.]MDN5685315.1 ABC transporter permease subunit [Brachybacterium sp.]
MTGNPFLDALAWLTDPVHWSGPSGVPMRTLEHLGYTVLGVLVAALIAIPIGLLVGHTGVGKGITVAVAGAARALPTLGLVTLFALLLGLGLTAPLLAFVVLAVPSLLAGAYSAVETADPATVDAARAQGMTEWQILAKVEIPLGIPLIVGGFRGATVQVVATAMLAAYVGNGGLGRYIFLGLGSQDYPLMIAGSLLVIVLALVLDLALLVTQRLTAPRGVLPAEN